MLPIFVIIGAAGALLEIKRIISRPPQDGDLLRVQQSEERLKRVLQEVQKELNAAKAEQQKDFERAAELEKAAQELRAAQAELAAKSKELERKAIGLTSENEELLVKVETLQLEHRSELRKEALKHDAEVESLRKEVSAAFEDFSHGSLTPDALMEKLHALGVDLQISASELQRLTYTDDTERTSDGKVELKLGSDWRSKLRLLSDDPERMARQLAEGAHRSALTAQGSSGRFPAVRTPPSVRKEISIFSRKTALLDKFSSPDDNEKENLGRPQQTAASATPALQQQQPQDSTAPKSSTSNTSPTKASAARKNQPAVPKLTFSKALRNNNRGLGNRDAFALTEMSVDEDDFVRGGHGRLQM